MTPQTVARMITTIASIPDEALVFERVVRPIAQPSWDVDDYLRSDGTVTQVLTAQTTTVISVEVPHPDGFQCFHRCQPAEGST